MLMIYQVKLYYEVDSMSTGQNHFWSSIKQISF